MKKFFDKAVMTLFTLSTVFYYFAFCIGGIWVLYSNFHYEIILKSLGYGIITSISLGPIGLLLLIISIPFTALTFTKNKFILWGGLFLSIFFKFLILLFSYLLALFLIVKSSPESLTIPAILLAHGAGTASFRYLISGTDFLENLFSNFLSCFFFLTTMAILFKSGAILLLASIFLIIVGIYYFSILKKIK